MTAMLLHRRSSSELVQRVMSCGQPNSVLQQQNACGWLPYWLMSATALLSRLFMQAMAGS
jgi:hypothetical protein